MTRHTRASTIAAILSSVAALVMVVACRKPPPLEDVWEVKVPVAEALDKPKADSKVMLQLHAGDVLAAFPGDPVSFERNGKTLSYRRMRQAVEDHAGLVADADVAPGKAPPASYFCDLFGEGEGRSCLTTLMRIHLLNNDYVVYRPSLSGAGRLALFEGRNQASREVPGLTQVSVQTVGGKPWLFVESALRKSAVWTTTELEILAPDRSLRTRLRVLLQEVDGRAGNRFLRSLAVVENGKLRRRGTSYVLDARGEPTQHEPVDEEQTIPP